MTAPIDVKRLRELVAWAKRRDWPRQFAFAHRDDLPLQEFAAEIGWYTRRPIVWAECSGPSDPVCGLARFSVHGCNSHGPSRDVYDACRWEAGEAGDEELRAVVRGGRR